MGKPYYVRGTDWQLARAIPMAEVSDGIYQLTLTVGQQLSPTDVQFGFYGNNQQWTPQFMGRTGSEYRITSRDLTFAVGSGMLSHPDGTVYLRTASALQRDAIYRLTVDLTQGIGAATLSSEKLDPTGLESLPDASPSAAPPTIYDLQGRRLPRPLPGINIVGGRKVAF